MLERRIQPEHTGSQTHLAKKDVDWKRWDKPAWLYRPWDPQTFVHKDNGMFSENIFHFTYDFSLEDRDEG